MTSTPESGAEPVSDEAVAAELVAQADDAVLTEVAAEEAAIADAGTGVEAEAEAEVEAEADADADAEPREPDAELLAAHDLALSALHEITKPQTVGPAAGYTLESDGVVSLRFENRLAGYPGWYWTVSLARVEGAEPTVLEVELLPGDGALLAPEWVPWATRLAEYHAQQAAAAEAAAEAEDDEYEPEDDGSDEDADDLDESDDEDDEAEDGGESILHAGDVDGVDIDELDDDYDEDEDPGDDESDDDEPDEDDDESDEGDDDSDEDESEEDESDEDDSDEDDDED